jgi:microcystin-dependent protein
VSNPFVGEVRMFAGNFAPRGWAMCQGQILSISQNAALFSLLGTNFGGNGTSTFALPNLQGSVPMHQGNGPGLTPRVVGEVGGEQPVTLLQTEMPAHNHVVNADTGGGTQASPIGGVWAEAKKGKNAANHYAPSSGSNVAMSTGALSATGGNLAHNNMQPYLCVTFIIALLGIFPARN